MTLKVLNLYAGIGGNRKLWDEVADVDVTAVEWDETRAEIYQDHFPEDTIVVANAHEYLENHLRDGWDFIWSSPPCQTHSRLAKINQNRWEYTEYPDMSLWQEILLLQSNADMLKYDYAVENVESYYEPMYNPALVGRHYIWSNFPVQQKEFVTMGKMNNIDFSYNEHRDKLEFDLENYDVPKSDKVQMLKDCVDPELGKHVLKAATVDKQTTTDQWT